MLNITKTVLKRPIAVIVLIAGMMIFGVTSIIGMPLKLIPDMQMPMLLVQIVYPQSGPEEVERLVTKELTSSPDKELTAKDIIGELLTSISIIIGSLIVSGILDFALFTAD